MKKKSIHSFQKNVKTIIPSDALIKIKGGNGSGCQRPPIEILPDGTILADGEG